MNDPQLTFAGRLGTAVTVHETTSGQVVATFRVANTPRRFKDGAWIDGPTTWHTVKAWNRLARHAAASLKAGEPVVVHGRLACEEWTGADNQQLTRYVVIASSIGHDLNHGTSTWQRAEARPATEAA